MILHTIYYTFPIANNRLTNSNKYSAKKKLNNSNAIT
jgi:hypothetical protein